MYRGRLWTMRQFAGFGTAEETNERFRYLLEHGQTGLSTAFDMPSLMGYDSDHPRSLGEVGREGVAIDVLDDVQRLFQGIDVGEVSVSMTINAPAAIMMAFYVVAAEENGIPSDRLSGIVRTAIEALAGVLGGTQSLHTNSYDEAVALPSEEAVRVALRTQQVIAHETGVTNTVDPLGGSYFLEALTDQLEQRAYEYFCRIDELGGMVEAVKRGFPQREIAEAAFELQLEYDSGTRKLVDVNSFTEGGEGEIEILRVDSALERKQVGRVQAVRARRDGVAVEAALTRVRERASGDTKLMPALLDAARAHASEGEIVEALQSAWGSYTETPVF